MNNYNEINGLEKIVINQWVTVYRNPTTKLGLEINPNESSDGLGRLGPLVHSGVLKILTR